MRHILRRDVQCPVEGSLFQSLLRINVIILSLLQVWLHISSNQLKTGSFSFLNLCLHLKESIFVSETLIEVGAWSHEAQLAILTVLILIVRAKIWCQINLGQVLLSFAC